MPPTAAAYSAGYEPVLTDCDLVTITLTQVRKYAIRTTIDDHDRHDDFHQCDEILVGLFVSGVIVALCGRVFDLAVIGHTIVSKRRTRCGRT